MSKFVNSNSVPSISLSTQCQKIAYSTMGPFMPLHYLPELIYVRLGRECLSGKSGLLSIQLLKPQPFTTYIYSEKIDAFCKLISKPPLASKKLEWMVVMGACNECHSQWIWMYTYLLLWPSSTNSICFFFFNSYGSCYFFLFYKTGLWLTFIQLLFL